MGGRLDLIAPPPNIQKLLTSCGLHKVLKIYQNLPEADRILRTGVVKEDHGFYVLFKVPKEFNITTVNCLRPAIQQAKQQGYKQFVFDFIDNRQITSVGIGILVNLHKELSTAGGGVHLVRLDPEVHSLLESANVLTQVPAYAKIEDVDEKLLGSAA
jgi:anti-anti-sigma factor